jgi:thymidylate synthase (FAD)
MTDLKVVPMQVDYIDHLGSDLNVVNAARVSFAKEVTELDLEKDTKLINYLAKHNHWSPLAHTAVTIRVKAPIFMARQFVKHQIGLVWNEESRRYIDDTPEFYIPEVWRGRPVNAKQGSSEEDVSKVIAWEGDDYNFVSVEAVARNSTEDALFNYDCLLRAGVAPEQARMVLPQNVMTNWIWTGSLVAFARVCKLRLDSHAQKEAQELASLMNEIIAPLYPVSWKALMDN